MRISPFLFSLFSYKQQLQKNAIVNVCFGLKSTFYTLVLLEQLNKIKTKADVVIIVDKETNEKYLNIIEIFKSFSAKIKIVPNSFSKRIFYKYKEKHVERDYILWHKLYCFGMTEYDVIVLIDSDVVIKKNFDEVFLSLESNSLYYNKKTFLIEKNNKLNTDLYYSIENKPEIAGVAMNDINEKIIFFKPYDDEKTEKINPLKCFKNMEMISLNRSYVGKVGLNLGFVVLKPNEEILNELLNNLNNLEQRTCCPVQEFVFRFFEARGSYLRLPQTYNTRRIERIKSNKEEIINNSKIYHFVEKNKLEELRKMENVFLVEWNKTCLSLEMKLKKKEYDKYREEIVLMRNAFLFK